MTEETEVTVTGTHYAVGFDKKRVPYIIALCDSLAKAEATGTASDAEDYTVIAVEKLADSFKLSELATMFNALPGEGTVERFADKLAATKRIAMKIHAAGGTTMATTKKRAKTKKATNGGTRGRKAEALKGRIKPLKREDKTWQKGSFRSALYQLLVESGSTPIEEFIADCEKKLKKSRGQILGAIQKLLIVKMAEVSG